MEPPITFNTVQMELASILTGYKLFKAGKYSEATPYLTSVLEIDPENWQARLLLGACYMKTGQAVTALRAFRWVSENCFNEVLKGKADKALQACKAAIERDPTTAVELQPGELDVATIVDC